MGFRVETSEQCTPVREVLIEMVVHHVIEEINEEKYKVENRKRKASEGDDNDEENEFPLTETKEEERSHEKSELSRLKKLIPTMSIKNNVTQLDIILEAIRYIDTLKDKLARREMVEELE